MLGPLLSLLLHTAQAEPAPPTWVEEPLATELHPVLIDPFLERWQAQTGQQMAGPGASSLFRSMSSRMDALLRIAAFDGQMPYLPVERQRRAASLAFTGASLGWQRSMSDVLDESEAVENIRGVLRSVFRPGLSLGGGADEAGQSANGGRSAAVAEAALTDPSAWRETAAAATRRGRPSLQTGLSGSLVSTLDSGLASPDDADSGAALARLAARGFVQVSHVGVDTMRLQVTSSPAPGMQVWSLGWAGLLREELSPRLALLGEVRGGTVDLANPDDDLRPHRYASAVDWRVVPERRWVLRASGAQQERSDRQIERIAGLEFRVNTSWHLPSPALGRPGSPTLLGPDPGTAPSRGPIPIAPLVSAPATRLAWDLGATAPSAPDDGLAEDSADGSSARP